LTAAVVHETRWRGVPWIAVPLLHLGRGRFYTMRHQIDLLRAASVVLAQTPGERQYLLDSGFDPDQVKIVSPGVHLAESARADGDRFREKYGLSGPLVLSLGTLDYDKGTPHLIEAAQRLWRDGRSLTLVLLGPQHESVWRALARLPERERAFCRYLGLVSEQEKWDAMDAAAVMAMPSRTESFGIVFLEAWACGKPVIGARAGALLDVIRDGVDGLLVDFGDVGALASALDRLLKDPALATELGQRGQEKVRRYYGWQHQYGHLREIVEELMARSEASPSGSRSGSACA
jgi:glycosyltransferase involved in cell wall biosynthesis